jgi:predicted PurR-regulated permease PerM
MDRTQGVLLALAGLLLAVTALLVRPFLQFLLLAVLLAYPLQPLQRRLARHTTERRSAAALVAATTVVVVLPALVVLRRVGREATGLLERIREEEITFTWIEGRIEGITGVEPDLTSVLRTALQETELWTVDGVVDVFGTLTHVAVGLGLTVFLLYYFLKDGSAFERWLRGTVPLPERVQDELHAEFDDVMWAVLASHVFIAVVQGFVAGLGLAVAGVPNAILWTIVMIVLAILPIIGSFLVWGPAVIYLVSVNRPLAAGFLLVYGTVVVGLTDDYLRPLVIDRYTETTFNPGVMLIGVLGGVYLIGFMGIFFGPIVVGLLRSVLDVYRREYGPSANGSG